MNAALTESMDLFTRVNILNQISTGSQVIDMLISTMIMRIQAIIWILLVLMEVKNQ